MERGGAEGGGGKVLPEPGLELSTSGPPNPVLPSRIHRWATNTHPDSREKKVTCATAIPPEGNVSKRN